MGKTPEYWRRSAQDSIEEVMGKIEDAMLEHQQQTAKPLSMIRDASSSEEPDVGIVEDKTLHLENTLVEMAQEYFNLAHEIRKIRNGSTMRNLKGKEPVGYSKRDGGAAHDALYASKSMNNNFTRGILWPLNLDEWEIKEAERISQDEWDKVSATGMKKYKKYIGGRNVYLITTKRDPPI